MHRGAAFKSLLWGYNSLCGLLLLAMALANTDRSGDSDSRLVVSVVTVVHIALMVGVNVNARRQHTFGAVLAAVHSSVLLLLSLLALVALVASAGDPNAGLNVEPSRLAVMGLMCAANGLVLALAIRAWKTPSALKIAARAEPRAITDAAALIIARVLAVGNAATDTNFELAANSLGKLNARLSTDDARYAIDRGLRLYANPREIDEACVTLFQNCTREQRQWLIETASQLAGNSRAVANTLVEMRGKLSLT